VFYTYVLRSEKDSNLYVGFTNDLKLTFEQHQNGRVDSTKHRGLFELIYYEARLNREDAARREKYLKSHYGKMFFHKRIKSYLTG